MPAVYLLALHAVAVTGLADIRQLLYQFCNRHTECCFNIFQCCLGILYRVMQPGGGNHFLVIRYPGDQFRNGTQVYMIGLIIVFSAVINPLVCLGCINTGTIGKITHGF